MKPILSLILILMLSPGVTAFANTNTDEQAIRGAIKDYIEGWYDADASRMERAVHPKLVKSSPVGDSVKVLNAGTLISYTRSGYGKTARDRQLVEISQIDIHRNMASAKLISTLYIEYFHLIKVGKNWKVLSALWADK